MDGSDLKKIEEMLQHHIGIMSESVQHKLDIVVEGHQMLSDKLDRLGVRLENRIDCVLVKLDAIAADLAAHRADTEAHHPVFRVKEPER